ncbi:MAG: CHASE2 domain-containing protein [Leptolyngbya sp. SIOISBB]|nr:CHASE2 domain-containing protein [Leptolyngbya sp. SIOISBB]
MSNIIPDNSSSTHQSLLVYTCNIMLEPGLQLNGQYQLIQQLGQGGFGQTWEIHANGTVKVLKVLLEDFPKAVELFQREAEVLSQLNHPGIPKAEANSYFCYSPEDSSEPLYGYVMEKISGMPLNQWMKLRDRQPISQFEAIDWLTQLTQILHYLHQHGLLHRDIKPANIMLADDGHLVLIDFGGVKAAAATYLQNQLGDVTGTRIASQGYTPTEQIEGQPTPQSDFFALGRTFIFLLTGKQPSEFASSSGKLNWQMSAPYVQPEFAAFLEELIAPFPEQRPQTAEEILEQLTLLRRVIEQNKQKNYRSANLGNLVAHYVYQPSTIPIAKRIRIGLFSGMVVSIGLVVLRFLGGLQPLELRAYDAFLRLRPLESPDDRIVVVTISDDDRQFQIEQGYFLRNEEQSIAYDGALQNLLRILEKHQPRAIGLDLYLDWMTEQESQNFLQSLDKPERLVTVCLAADNEISPLKTSPPQQIAFTNFEVDADERVRRHLLLANFDVRGDCKADYALSTQLAYKYLQPEGISSHFTEQGDLAFDDTIFQTLSHRAGGYQSLNSAVGQVLLNYRASQSPMAMAKTLSLKAVLTDSFQPADIQDRIVLIGLEREGIDTWATPLGDEVSGVFIHAHMTSQLISSVLENRSLLRPLAQPLEVLLIIGMAIVGSTLTVLSVRRSAKLLIYAFAIATSIGIPFILFLQGWWLPVVPSVFALAGAGGLSAISLQSKSLRKLL